MFAFVTALLGLANGLMSYFNTKQLEEAGAALATLPNIQRALDAQRLAQKIRDDVASGKLTDDPFLRT